MRIAAAITLILTAAVLAGCGKAGRPASPDQIAHPQVYPQVAPAGRHQAAPVDQGTQWPPEQAQRLVTGDGTFIDPSVRQHMLATHQRDNVAQRTSSSGRGGIVESGDQSYVDQPLLEPRP